MAELVDTHCHLTGKSKEYVNTIIENAAKVGVTRMICIGASDGTASAAQAVKLAETYPNIWATIGVHPHDAKQTTKVTELERFAEHPKVVAVGETGLDFFRDWAPVDAQRKLFENTISFAKEIKKPIVIHCRDARDEVYKTLKTLGADTIGGVFHCYSEDSEFAKKLLDINFMVSFPGAITFKKADAARETVKAIPLSQIMLETDTPYMAPEPFRGGDSEPMHVYQIALKIAEAKGLTFEEIAATTTNNAIRTFGIT